MYKLVQLYRSTPVLRCSSGKSHQHYDKKLAASVSRSRRILLELALSNPWDYFATLTLSPEKNDRFDLDSWYRCFYEFIKYQRKAHGLVCRYVIVPERHSDGAWHAHGLFSGNMELIPFADLRSSDRPYPVKLLDSDYFNWLLYEEKFGGCTFGLIRNSVAAGFYMTKYLSKDLAQSVSQVGKHLYYASQGLNRANKMGQLLVRSDYLDSLLVNKYEYCATGIVQASENWDSHFVGDLLDVFPCQLLVLFLP